MTNLLRERLPHCSERQPTRVRSFLATSAFIPHWTARSLLGLGMALYLALMTWKPLFETLTSAPQRVEMKNGWTA